MCDLPGDAEKAVTLTYINTRFQCVLGVDGIDFKRLYGEKAIASVYIDDEVNLLHELTGKFQVGVYCYFSDKFEEKFQLFVCDEEGLTRFLKAPGAAIYLADFFLEVTALLHPSLPRDPLIFDQVNDPDYAQYLQRVCDLIKQKYQKAFPGESFQGVTVRALPIDDTIPAVGYGYYIQEISHDSRPIYVGADDEELKESLSRFLNDPAYLKTYLEK